MRLDLAGYHVARDDAFSAAIDHDQIEHFGAGVHLHITQPNLALKLLIRTQQQLLAGLAAGIKGARYLRTAERAVVKLAAILTREGHALGDALVDDVNADLRQPVNICLPRPKVAAFDRIVKQAKDAVAVVAIVLGGIDAALRRNAMRATWAILVAKALYLVA